MQKNTQEQSQQSFGALLWELCEMLVIAFVIVTVIKTFFFQPFSVEGVSMEPNFQEKDYLIVNEWGRKFTDVHVGDWSLFTVAPRKGYERGDVVVVRAPQQGKKFYIKRVVGLPGERIAFRNGVVVVFNAEHPEGYVLDETAYLPHDTVTEGAEGAITIAADHYYVLGDNRMHSSDSRTFGPLHHHEMIGTVLLRAWPLGSAEVF